MSRDSITVLPSVQKQSYSCYTHFAVNLVIKERSLASPPRPLDVLAMAESPLHISQAEHCWQDMQQQHVGLYALADDTRNSANIPSPIHPLDQSHTGAQLGRSDQAVAVQNAAATACVSLDRSSPVPKDVPREFRVLLNKIAEKLDDENIASIAFVYQVPSNVKQALPCFEHLHAHGVFSWEDTEPLKTLLRNIWRYDLVTNLVEEYEAMREEEQKLVGETVCT